MSDFRRYAPALVAVLGITAGAAQAQHSGHGAHDHAQHAPKAAATKSAVDPHAGHRAQPEDPHARHQAAKPDTAAASDPHAQHAAPETDAHAHHHGAHDAAVVEPATVADPHAHHHPAPTPAVADPHAGHADRMPHAGHAATHEAAADPHAHHHGHHAAMPKGDLPPDHAPREPIPAITDADRAAAFPDHLHGHEMHGDAIYSLVRIDRLEAFDGDHGRGQAWEADGWIGGDVDRLWLKASGERSGGRTESADLDVLYGRSVSPWWDVVAGARQSFRPGPSRTFTAFGVQGLAPYMFEVSAMAYAGEGGQVLGELEVEYELLLTNRLILQPVVELDVARRDDPARGIGSGLVKGEAGLRLRYEFTRKFAPYIGVVHERAFGDTRDLREAAGEDSDDTKLVLGLRTWF